MDKNIRLKKITGRVRVSRKSTMTCARGSCRVLSARSSFVAQPWARLGATRVNNVQWNSTATKDSSATSTAANVSVSGIFLHIQKLAPNFFSFFLKLNDYIFDWIICGRYRRVWSYSGAVRGWNVRQHDRFIPLQLPPWAGTRWRNKWMPWSRRMSTRRRLRQWPMCQHR
jgi:hypothetical protein